MNNLDDSDPGLGIGKEDPKMQKLISDLHKMCIHTMPATARAEIAHTVASTAYGSSATPRTARTPIPLRKPHVRCPLFGPPTLGRLLASFGAALLVVVGSGFGMLYLQRPSKPSAATVLTRAAYAITDVTSGQVVHEIAVNHAVVSLPGQPQTGDRTAEQWTQVDGSGKPQQSDLTYTTADGTVDERMVADAAGNVWTYDPAQNTVSKT